MPISSGCEPEANGKAAPSLPVFTALKPATGRVQPGSQTGALLVPSVLNTAAHLYQKTPIACVPSKHRQQGRCRV